MRSIKFSAVIFSLAIALTALSTFAQSSVFVDSNVDYSFALPEEKWKLTVKPSATSPNVEFVYGDRREGHLDVRRITVAKDAILSDIIQDDEQRRQFLPGYIAGKQENFSGKLRGTIFNFEYVAAGRTMAGRYYFLRANDTTVYVLRFSGMKDSLRAIRNQTDSIARTFGVK